MTNERDQHGHFPRAISKRNLNAMGPQILVPSGGKSQAAGQLTAAQLRSEGIVALRATSERIVGTARLIGGLSFVSIGLLGTESLSMSEGYYFSGS